MKYQELWKEENTQIHERYDLCVERIELILEEESVKEPFRSYFCFLSKFVSIIEELARIQLREEFESYSLEDLKVFNHKLYQDVLVENYSISYANPTYAVEQLGADLGPLLSAFYVQLRSAISFAYECKLTEITLLLETLIEIYNTFEEEIPTQQKLKKILYSFYYDNVEHIVSGRLREQLDPTLTFAKDIIMNRDLSDLRYLYAYGEYISDAEFQIADFLNELPEESIIKMAQTYTQGFKKGFEATKRDMSIKKSVMVRYPIGFERMIRESIRLFREMGLEPILYRSDSWVVTQGGKRKMGYLSSAFNKQYDYDHRYDNSIFLDKKFKEKRLIALRHGYQLLHQQARDFAGPAVIETFGEEGFQPLNKKYALTQSKEQESLSIEYANEAMPISNEYMPGSETSFTIIAFPIPAIGEPYKEIFEEIIRINTLDYQLYQDMQQRIIDTLDHAEHVVIRGRNGNETSLRVSLSKLSNPMTQSNFENCVADVNIPVGEVFTSPKLVGTSGLLHVKKVYLGDFQYENLKIWFEDGMITNYSCDNFDNLEEGKTLIRQQILKNHETLPMGEFAIGTNTTAYAVSEKYGITQKLPILIAEKMGPHFAVGDTCYSWSEDNAVYNPDGKEIVARDNEISLLRKEDLSKAYYGCHTDITIPYSELDEIIAIDENGMSYSVIREGKFVVSGTEKLNEPFAEME